jgi:hypothetical protein
MDDDLLAIWRDDRLIDAAARGDLHHTADAAAAPLCALARVADARPLPRLDVDPTALVDSRRNHRYAVRSLAVAVAAVATLSTSGVAAVVTGDPFRPAKAVWREIQDHTVARSDADDEALGSGAALGAPVERPATQTVVREAGPPSDLLVSDARQGQTAHAPSEGEPEATDAGVADETPPEAAPPADDDSADDDSAAGRANASSAEDAETSAEGQSEQDPAEEQDGDDEQSAQPPSAEQQPPPDDQPDDDGLDPLVLPGAPSQEQEQDIAQPPSAQRAGAEGDDADEQPELDEPDSTSETTGDGEPTDDGKLAPAPELQQ